MRKLLLILYCAFVTLNATHTFYVHNQNYIKGEKRGKKITMENGLFYNQRLSLLTEWTILRRICLCVLHYNARQTKKDIRPLGIFCSTWRLGPWSHDAISGKKAFKHFVFICRWELVPTGFQLVLHWKRTSYFSLLLIWKSNFLKPYLRRSRR